MKKCIGLTILMVIMFSPAMIFAEAMPDTGQTKCYDNEKEIPCPQPGEDFYGQDAQYDGPKRSYTKLGNTGVVLSIAATQADGWVMTRDNTTGLIWEVKQNNNGTKNYNDPRDADNTYTWYDPNPVTNGGAPGTNGSGTDTEDFINALNNANFGGFNDWRMPTFNEVSSLVNNDPFNPFELNESGLLPIYSSWYFSSTPFAGNTRDAWGMSRYIGSSGYSKSYSGHAQAVRGAISKILGNTIIIGRMADNKDGTVTDTATGLMWQQATAPGKYNWKDALAYAESLSLSGFSDWRLPDRNELRTLVDYKKNLMGDKRYDPATDVDAFPDTETYYGYWSSTTHGELGFSADWAFEVGFGAGGADVTNLKSRDGCVRAVRGEQFAVFEDLDGDGYTEENDCNDNDATIHPGATEICGDGKDNNCNGNIDEGCVTTQPWFMDADGDGYSDGLSLQSVNRPSFNYYLSSELTATSGDCNDNDANIHPGTTEICGDGKDNNCDGNIDEGCVITQIWYKDADGDWYSDGTPLQSVNRPSLIYYLASELTAISGDCSDSDTAIHPGATEVCGDGKDNNCNGTTDEGCPQNQSPTANAGAGQMVKSGDAVILDGAGSTDSDGTVASYLWAQTGGSTVALSQNNIIKPTFTAPSVSQATTLTFQLTVEDNDGLTSTDTVSITVNKSSDGGGGGGGGCFIRICHF